MPCFSELSSPSIALNAKALSNPNPKLGFCSSGEWVEVKTFREEAGFYPEAVERYKFRGGGGGGGVPKLPPGKLLEKIRTHLAFLGWKIEHNNEIYGLSKFRYISPLGRTYYSLRKVCNDLSTTPNSAAVVAKHNLGDGAIRDLLQVEPKHDPDSVFEWTKLMKSGGQVCKAGRAVSLRVKRHLVFHGWRLFYKDKGNNIRELRYITPPSLGSKTHCSLLSACQFLIEKGLVNGENVVEVKASLGIESQSQPLDSRVNVNVGADVVGIATSGMGKRIQEIQQLDSGYGKKKNIKVQVGDSKSTEENTNGVEAEAELGIVSLPQSMDSQVNSNVGANVVGAATYGKGKRTKDIKLLEACHGKKKRRKVQVGDGKSRLILSKARTYQPKTTLSSLIDNNLVADMAQVYYQGRKEGSRLKEGWVTRDGIKCKCCHEVFALTRFEAHAGSTNHRPAANIILEDGRSLFQLHNELKGLGGSRPAEGHHHRTGSDMSNNIDDGHGTVNSDICAVCNFGGELVLCDHCPASFHTSCIGLEEIPQGDWFCTSCCCSVCSQKRGSGVNILTCGQCERWCHAGCLSLDARAGEEWFCSSECENIHSRLHELIGKPVDVGVGADNLTWRLLKSSKSSVDDGKVKEYLNRSLSLMRECFEPIKDASTGRDMVEDLIYSRRSENPKQANYQGFYTVVLEKDGELVTVANVRVYGKSVAEMPLVGTSFQHRRQGMCKILMDELERQLREMGVERLALPAVPHVLETWTASFGFSQMTPSQRLQLLQHSFLEFQGTIMCQKLL